MMKIKFQYEDWSEWEGELKDAAQSPDKGVIRMFIMDDHGRTVMFIYDDFYYIIPLDGGRFQVGSGICRRDFILEPGRDGAISQERFKLPENVILRLGKQVSQKEAIKFGLINKGGKLLSDKAPVYVEVAGG